MILHRVSEDTWVKLQTNSPYATWKNTLANCGKRWSDDNHVYPNMNLLTSTYQDLKLHENTKLCPACWAPVKLPKELKKVK